MRYNRMMALLAAAVLCVSTSAPVFAEDEAVQTEAAGQMSEEYGSDADGSTEDTEESAESGEQDVQETAQEDTDGDEEILTDEEQADDTADTSESEDIADTEPAVDTDISSGETSDASEEAAAETADIAEDETIQTEETENSAGDDAENTDENDGEETAEEELDLYAAWYTWDSSNGVLTIRGQLPDTYLTDCVVTHGLADQVNINNRKVKKLVITPGTKTGKKADYMFFGMNNLAVIEGLANLDTSAATSMVNMFGGCSSLVSLDLRSFDTSRVSDMSHMFSGCSSLTAVNVSGFRTSYVNDMSAMFRSCSALKSVDLSRFDTSNVTDMSSMFEECTSLSALDLSHFDTSNVSDMCSMFEDCGAKYINVSGFDTSNVISMTKMFRNCSSLTSLDLSGFDTGMTGFMSSMFCKCSSLTSLDLSKFDTSGVSYAEYMFCGCTSLRKIYVSEKWTTEGICGANGENMFCDCRALTGGKGTVYNSSRVGGEYAHIDGGASRPGYLTSKITPPAKPSFTVNAGSRKAIVQWNGQGDVSYRVYRYENNRFKFLTETNGTGYTDTGLVNGRKYGYLVRAFSRDVGSEYTTSDIKYVTPNAAEPAKPTFTLTASNGQVTVKWNAVNRADCYRVYRYENGAYKFLRETADTGYTDTGLTNGRKYGYLVRAFNAGTGSAYTSADIKYALPTTAVPAKPSFTAASATSKATVKWNSVSGATSYRVYRYENGAYKLLKETTGTGYTDTGLKNGVKYGYLVRAFRGNAGSGYTNSDIRYAIPVAKPNVRVYEGDRSVTLTWSMTKGASTYRIYRYENGTYKFIRKTDSATYVANGLENGKEYGFLIRAFNSKGGSSYTANDVCYGTPMKH